MNKRTLILGASPNPERYAYKATEMLSEHQHEVFPVGLRDGEIGVKEILTNSPLLENIDTVTLYIGPKNQPKYYDYIINTINPKRIIFNPGTENKELVRLASKKGIKTEEACTLILLSIDNY
tara:strand:- start:20273 stop:20638 length:366 start_codon:yes stop_codon:yes gene_type:complete